MKKYDYYKQSTFINPQMPYNAFWWSNSTTDYHTHCDFYEMFLTVQDGCVHICNDAETALPSHTLCVIPENLYHAVVHKHPNQMPIIFTLAFTKSFLDRYIDSFSTSFTEMLTGKDCVYINVDDVTDNFLISLANKATYDENENTRLQSVKLFLAIAGMLYETNHSSLPVSSITESYALDVKTKIDNLEYIGEISAIYEKYPVSPSILIKNFKKLTGQTIIKYQVIRRMKYACTLLTSTDYSVLQICSLTGYDSLSHFLNNFKKFTGYTPSNYRKNNSSNNLNK